jgi:hypothetical protein
MREVLFVVRSKFGREIRLTPTVWRKIEAHHPEFGERSEYLREIETSIGDPEYIIRGWAGEYLALRWSSLAPARPKYLCVVYRELNGDGFIITAFFISRYEKLLERGILWRKQPS